ncbi:MAG: hypothetical protein JWM47_2965 [Acidimicrobiales bacterium]|nr:hypothetical protein [Acidimicrobiales bacterium]
MDLLDVIDLSQEAEGRLRRAGAAAGTLLIAGWVWKWPVIHPFVQGMLDTRTERLTEMYTSAIDRLTKNLGS